MALGLLEFEAVGADFGVDALGEGALRVGAGALEVCLAEKGAKILGEGYDGNKDILWDSQSETFYIEVEGGAPQRIGTLEEYLD